VPRDVCYFFFADALTEAAFGVIVEDTPTAGATTFLGCLGFLASRLPRVVLFAIMLLPICRSRRRQPCGSVWAHMTTLSRFIFFERREPVLQAKSSGLRQRQMSATGSVECGFVHRSEAATSVQ
jgi:hypothetical protein